MKSPLDISMFYCVGIGYKESLRKSGFKTKLNNNNNYIKKKKKFLKQVSAQCNIAKIKSPIALGLFCDI